MLAFPEKEVSVNCCLAARRPVCGRSSKHFSLRRGFLCFGSADLVTTEYNTVILDLNYLTNT